MSEIFSVLPIRCEVFRSGDELVSYAVRSIPRDRVVERMIVAITSKIVSIEEGALVKRGHSEGTPEQRIEKRALIEREADLYLGETLYEVSLTMKHGMLIPSAGIDESNSEDGSYILFPKDPYASAKRIREGLRKAWGLAEIGVIITDSHTQPLRKGVSGIGLSHYGFKATRDLVGQEDLFGREAKMTHVNVLDSLAVAAVYRMGEVAERCPIALIYGSGAEFFEGGAASEIAIAPDEDLYGHLLFPKRKAGL